MTSGDRYGLAKATDFYNEYSEVKTFTQLSIKYHRYNQPVEALEGSRKLKLIIPTLFEPQ